MRRLIFLDTGALMALFNDRDRNHEAAVLFKNGLGSSAKYVMTNYILDELYTLGLKNIGHRATVAMKREIVAVMDQKIIALIWVTPEIADHAWSVFEKYNVDKSWSFTDCVSYSVMKQIGINEAFTFDHHFSQMGFDRAPAD
jgi:predicted nucleic acid-binding protein